jgi:cyanobactin cluster PatC/TenC/TruC protein
MAEEKKAPARAPGRRPRSTPRTPRARRGAEASAPAVGKEATAVAAVGEAHAVPPHRIHGTDLSTGLVDYAMWVEMFAETGEGTKPPEGQPYRRGRIWA